ncbi:MAG: PEP/pyruvate-binding domain-containing protein [Pseudomonadota bacterium]
MKLSLPGRVFILTSILILTTTAVLANEIPAAAGNAQQYRQWIMDMKAAERGPFTRIRWFCNDGRVLPPKAYACGEGGGRQHGEWSAHTKELRNEGYKVANLLAEVDAETAIVQPDFNDSYNQLLIEKFLITADDGWILRRAIFYRGAIQEESEAKGGRELLVAMSAEPEWTGHRFPALRIGARLLPHGKDSASAQKVRQVSASLSEQDARFKSLRGKIHGTPDAGDAKLVRDYANGVSDPAMKAKYRALADDIDAVYQAAPLPDMLEADARRYTAGPWLQKLLRDAASAYAHDAAADNRYRSTATLLADLRDALPRIRSASVRVDILDLSQIVEAENFRASAELREQLPQATRHQRVEWLQAAINAAYGTGAINQRGRTEQQQSLVRLESQKVMLGDYLKALGYLGRVPGWATQGLRYQFYESMQKLSDIEPLAMVFIQDQLRGSPLLFYSQVLDSLQRDANSLAGVRHKLFGKEIGVGFHALNPGLARGVLHAPPDLHELARFSPDGIYLLPETVSDLPPISGIMTAGEGNPLSHVQLLARNLGIPNVGVNTGMLSAIRKHDGESVVMAVSPAGLVELSKDSDNWNAVFGETESSQDVVIRPDLTKLDLGVKDFINLDDLSADDSGRTVGPKAAKLGELRKHFPEAVSPGVAIPFGVFREVVLDQPHGHSRQTVFEWMVENYRHIEQLPAGSQERRDTAERFRAELYELILRSRLDAQFQQRLRSTMEQAFGSLDGLGVFVRSDTNVEDLAGFTGAGLNLTLPNVVGFDNVVNGIADVWASPFTARAFAWRQSHMESPENVYPAVLLLKSVPNDKSGVMVTQDIDTGDRDLLSVAVNEGVGGAVDGQSAESLRIDTRDGSVHVLAMATAPWRRNPLASGGIDKLPVSGDESVLQPDEIKQLITFTKELPQRFPPITDDQGNPAPADIEFGFLDGKLHLFQLRPFLESRKARGSDYLSRMDEALYGTMGKMVNMQEMPNG